MAEPRAKLIQQARQLEAQRNYPQAIQLYLNAGAVLDAARLLAALGRFSDAAKAALSQTRVDPGRLRELSAERRKPVLVAASYFAKAGEVKKAVSLLHALGERVRAAELLEQSGDLAGANAMRQGQYQSTGVEALGRQSSQAARGSAGQRLEADGKLEAAIAAYAEAKQYDLAARLALKMQNHSQAARFFFDDGKLMESAQCYVAAGDSKRALQTIVRVPRQDTRYRQASVMAIQLASETNELSLPLENMLARFVAEGPKSSAEVEAFCQLGRLYQANDFPENAREAYGQVLQAVPDHTEATKQLGRLEREDQVAMRMQMGHIVREQAAFRGETPAVGPRGGLRPPLAELPDLPDLPPRGQPAAPSRAPASAPAQRDAGAQPAGTMAWDTTAVNPPPALKQPMPTRAGRAAPQHAQAAPPPQSPNPAVNRTQAMSVAQAAAPAPAQSAGPMVLEAGSVVADRYQLIKKIGEGGMAAVFRATDVELGEEIALKVFTSPVQNDEMIQRFKQELKLTRRLSHPNIIRLFDIGVFCGFRYISMELLEGQSLETLLGRPLEIATAVGYMVQACAGLQVAHDQGVIHRDVKPENFFVTSAGQLKVMDFGIAKQQAGPTFTVVGRIAGTPAYMCPEQINNFSSVTPASDIYALGVVAYQLFTGTLPFTHDDLMALLMMHVNDVPDPPTTRHPALPPSIETVILKAMAKDPAARYESCHAFAAALQAAATAS